MSREEFLQIKINALEKVAEIMESQYSALKNANRVLQEKLDNATETIRHLNNKIDKMKDNNGKTL